MVLGKTGRKRQYDWAEIQQVKEVTRAMHTRQRLEVQFVDGSEFLKLFSHAMRLPDSGFRDRLAVTGTFATKEPWDRPVKTARFILQRFIDDYETTP